MGLFDKLVQIGSDIGSAIDQATKYTGPQAEQKEPASQDLLSLGRNIADVLDKKTEIGKVLPVSFTEMAALGGAFAEMAPSLQSFAKDFQKDGLSAIPLKSIAQDALKQAGIDVSPVTDMLKANGQGGEWIQAVPKQIKPSSVPLNPAMMMMAAMLAGIDKKLDTIQETQESILSFLEKDKQAEQQANLKFLSDTLSGYKYNWDNDQYKQNHHVKALDIKQTSDKNIFFYFSRITDELAKAPSFQMDQGVKNKIRNLEDMMNEYRLAIYEFGFSSFLEMLLLGNFKQEYLDQIAGRIEKYNREYTTLYDRCVDTVKKYTEGSVETRVLTGLGNLTKAIGNFASNTDALKNKSVDKWLQDSSDTLRKNNDSKVEQAKSLFAGSRDTGSDIFVSSIRNIAAINNQTKDISFDGENIYLNLE